METNKPALAQCHRCLKSTDGVHTCTPTDGWRQLEEQLAAAQLHIERLTAALEKIGDTAPGEGSHQYMALEALTQPANLDALNEERARVLEEAAKIHCEAQGSAYRFMMAEAAIYRARKEAK